jgi:AbiTii
MRAGDRTLIDEIEQDALNGKVALADTLRKLITLGGRAGSSELRDWASLELTGYRGRDIELPEYRKPGAVIKIDGVAGYNMIRGQQISPRNLPDAVRSHIREEVPLGHPIAEIEAMVEAARAGGGYINLTLPQAQDVATLMNATSSKEYQTITAIYWTVGQQLVFVSAKTTNTTIAPWMKV